MDGARNEELPSGSKIGPSDSYGKEKLLVGVTVRNEEGALESTTCTTNFTVVLVDVEIGGADEDQEEKVGAFEQSAMTLIC